MGGVAMNISGVTTLPVTRNPFLMNITWIAVGYDQSFFVNGTGSVYVAGICASGRCGFYVPPSVKLILPTLVPNLKDIIMVRSSSNFAIAMDLHGNLFGFGANDVGQLGFGHTDTVYNASLINGIPNSVQDFSVGENHVLVLLTSRQVQVLPTRIPIVLSDPASDRLGVNFVC
jgi:alpha-tubulin suppressor-like RCC1 family protein